jgi:hypothetical protein
MTKTRHVPSTLPPLAYTYRSSPRLASASSARCAGGQDALRDALDGLQVAFDLVCGYHDDRPPQGQRAPRRLSIG